MNAVEVALVTSAALAMRGKHDEAARVSCSALVQSKPSCDGWLLPVDPLIHATAHSEAWAPVLATLLERAR